MLSHFKVNIICDNISEISSFLWDQNVPHAIEGDEYFEHNRIILTFKPLFGDILIVFDKNVIDFSIFKKIYIIGKNHSFKNENFDIQYWEYQKKWIRLTNEQFFS